MNNSDEQFKKDLAECETLNEVLKTANKYYDLDQPMGIASKIVVTQGIIKIIKMVRAVKRKLPLNFKL